MTDITSYNHIAFIALRTYKLQYIFKICCWILQGFFEMFLVHRECMQQLRQIGYQRIKFGLGVSFANNVCSICHSQNGCTQSVDTFLAQRKYFRGFVCPFSSQNKIKNYVRVKKYFFHLLRR